MHKTDEIIHHLKELFNKVVEVVTVTPPTDWGPNQTNAKGDLVKWFDVAADQAVCHYLETEFPYSLKLFSEEDSPRHFGTGSPEFIMILDPVDGSENFARGLRPSATAIALIPAHQPINTQTIQYALMGNLYTKEIWWAARGEGAYYNDQPLHPQVVNDPSQLFISCDINRYIIPRNVNELMARFRAVRISGAAIMSLTTVATGVCPVHIDPRGTLTPENFLAPSLLITEVGGLITDLEGSPLSNINDLTDRFAILAATTPDLHATAVEYLHSH